ncbi:hypothetical protein BDZ91DRAFT_767926 [Kalaharituber pfeilii]|nr:hypothetical protein BDZ91DRAFT_767926 [Kalaharituber pfeilii]
MYKYHTADGLAECESGSTPPAFAIRTALLALETASRCRKRWGSAGQRGAAVTAKGARAGDMTWECGQAPCCAPPADWPPGGVGRRPGPRLATGRSRPPSFAKPSHHEAATARGAARALPQPTAHSPQPTAHSPQPARSPLPPPAARRPPPAAHCHSPPASPTASAGLPIGVHASTVLYCACMARTSPPCLAPNGGSICLFGRHGALATVTAVDAASSRQAWSSCCRVRLCCARRVRRSRRLWARRPRRREPVGQPVGDAARQQRQHRQAQRAPRKNAGREKEKNGEQEGKKGKRKKGKPKDRLIKVDAGLGKPPFAVDSSYPITYRIPPTHARGGSKRRPSPPLAPPPAVAAPTATHSHLYF